MFRMITLMWIMGVVLCAIPAQAGTLSRGGHEPGARPNITTRFEWGRDGSLAVREVEVEQRVRSRATRAARVPAAKPTRLARTKKATRLARVATPPRVAARAQPDAVSQEHQLVATRRSGKTRTAVAPRPAQDPLSSLFGIFQTGIASHYGEPQRLASGGWFNPNAMTAAHKTLPFGTKVRVTHLGSGRSVDVTINDRGPYIGGRIIDLSTGAAEKLGMRSAGLAKVKLEVLGR